MDAGYIEIRGGGDFIICREGAPYESPPGIVSVQPTCVDSEVSGEVKVLLCLGILLLLDHYVYGRRYPWLLVGPRGQILGLGDSFLVIFVGLLRCDCLFGAKVRQVGVRIQLITLLLQPEFGDMQEVMVG